MGIARNLVTLAALAVVVTWIYQGFAAHEPNFSQQRSADIGELIERLESDRVVEQSLSNIAEVRGE